MKKYKKIFQFAIKNNKINVLILVLITFFQSLLNILSVLSIGLILMLFFKQSSDVNFLIKLMEKLNYEEIHINIILIFFLITLIVSGIVTIATTRHALKIKYIINKNIFIQIYSKFFNSNYDVFKKVDKGRIISSFVTEMNRFSTGCKEFALIIVMFIQSLIFMLIPLSIAFYETLLFILIFVLISLPYIYLFKKNKIIGKKNVNFLNQYTNKINEIFNYPKFLIANNYSKYFLNKTIEPFSLFHKTSIDGQTINIMPVYLLPPIAIASMIFSYMVVFQKDLITIGVVFFSFYRLIPMVSTLIKGNLNIAVLLEVFEQITNLSNLTDKHKSKSGSKSINDKITSIKFKKINFKIGHRTILKNLDKNFKIGKINHLSEKSGYGKTTMLDLLSKLYENYSGNIIINNKYDLKEINTLNFRSKISYVLQEPFLFDGTILENLVVDQKNISKKDIKRILTNTGLTNIIKKLPRGLNSNIENMKSRFSGGETQRISIARALIKKSEIIILDESLNALDEKSMNSILKMLSKVSQKVLIIYVAHTKKNNFLS